MLHDLKNVVFPYKCPSIIGDLYCQNITIVLTIPVNNIETIPERPRPSASMYLKDRKKKLTLKCTTSLPEIKNTECESSLGNSLREIWKKDKKATLQVLKAVNTIT